MFKRFVSILLAAVILFAEAGQVVYAHTCFKSNETSFSLYAPAHCKDEVVEKSCCTKKHEQESEECISGKKSCCGVSSKYVQQSFPTHETELKKTTVAKNILLPVIWFTAFQSVPKVFSRQAFVSSSAPPVYSSAPSFLCVYRC